MNPLDRLTWAATDALVSLRTWPALILSFIAAVVLMVGLMEGLPS